jgi:hypothetical protein
LCRKPPAMGGGGGGGSGKGAGGVTLSDLLGLESPTAPRLLSTPCGEAARITGEEPAAAGGGASRSHCFHTMCLADWLRRSCRCPLCKTDLRPFLRAES